MDKDKEVESDSDSSYVVVSDGGSVGSDSESYVIVGSDSESDVVSVSGEGVVDESKEQLENVDTDSCRGTDSEEGKQKLEYSSSDSESDLSDEIKRLLNNADKGSYVDTDSENNPSDSDESRQDVNSVDKDSYVDTFDTSNSDEGRKELKNVDSGSSVGTNSECQRSDSGFDQSHSDVGSRTIISVNKKKVKSYNCKFHTYPCKRIGCPDDCSEYCLDLRVGKKVDINHATMENVLPFLPAKMLCKLRTVSKDWDGWIGGSFFTHKQTCYFKDVSGVFCQIPGEKPLLVSLDSDVYGVPNPSLDFLPERVTVKASCNGLLCCETCDGENTSYICNPVNRKWKELPKSRDYHGPESSLALAFVPSVLNFEPQFKLVCVFGIPDHAGVYFDVYSSKSSSWKLSETVCYELEVMQLNGNGLFLNGVVFWETLAGCILAYDLKAKQYSLLPLPMNCGPEGAMTELNGEMCYILPCEEDGDYTLNIYGGMAMNLKRRIYLADPMFSNVSDGLRALAIVNDDVGLLLLGGNKLIAYHVKAERVQILRWDNYRRTVSGYERYLPYVNSLVEI